VGVGRLGFGTVALLLEPDTLGAMTGVALGAFLPVLVGWLALRDADRRRAHRRLGGAAVDAAGRTRWAPGGVLRETLHNSHALLAFFALSNTDVIVARSTLDEHQAGLYAGGLILAKAVLFLPQFVVVVAFPSMSRQGADRRSKHLLGLAMVLGIGLVTVLGVAVLSSLAVVFVGGPEYAALQHRLWVFAALGTLLALLQLMVYDVVARQHQRMVYVIWAGMAALLAVTPFVGSVTGLVGTVVAVDAVLFTVLLLASLRAPAGSETPQPTETPVP
jgi:O-antigen/teichoic acid export membrane protein